MSYAALYPVEWRELAHEIKEIYNWQCAACGKQCRRPGEPWDGWQRTLTLAHLCQEYEAEVVTVCPLCIICHLRYDAEYSWRARRRHERIRRRLAGQLPLPLDALKRG